MKTLPVYATPAATWPLNCNWTLRQNDAGAVLLSFSYLKDETDIYSETLAFSGCRATRSCVEVLTREDQQGAGDSAGVIYEVMDSDWIPGLQADTWPEARGSFELHHYIVYFDDLGLYEFAAESVGIVVEDE